MQVMAEEESNQQRRMNQYGLMGTEMVYQQPVVVEESYQMYDMEQQYQQQMLYQQQPVYF